MKIPVRLIIMADDDLDFNSLFEEEPGDPSQKKKDDKFTFDDIDTPEEGAINEGAGPAPGLTEEEGTVAKKKRSSLDFQPDMDALLLTAQSPMIIEGMKHLTKKDYSAKTLPVYTEALKGIDLYLKIIARNPKNYFKLAEDLRNDIDCNEVEKTAYNLYNTKFKAIPVTEDHITKAYDLLKEKIKAGYDKAIISRSANALKKYFLLSGGLNTDLLTEFIQNSDPNFRGEISHLTQRITSAINIVKGSNPEIAKGLKGRDVNIFIIKASELLSYYFQITGNRDAADYYRRLNNNYKKYQIIRE